MPSFICACVYWEFLRDSKLPPLVQKKEINTAHDNNTRYC